jgi:hypothetical protein
MPFQQCLEMLKKYSLIQKIVLIISKLIIGHVSHLTYIESNLKKVFQKLK